MGVKAARMQRARTRALAAGISRQIRERDANDPVLIARDQRIKVARREARRALRARAAADRAGRAADTAAGAAIARLLDEGLSLSDATVLLDVSRSAAKRLARLATGATGRARGGVLHRTHRRSRTGRCLRRR